MKINQKIQTELLSGTGIFFAVWTVTFLYSSLMEPIGFSTHYWFSTCAFLMSSGCLISALIIKKPYVIAPGLGVGWFAAHQILPQSHLLNFYLCIILSGLILMLVSRLKFIKKAEKLLPDYLQATMSIGIGCLFMRFALEQQAFHIQHPASAFLFISTIILLLIFKKIQNRWGSLITVGIIIGLGLILHTTHWKGAFSAPAPMKTLQDLSSLSIHVPTLVRQVFEMSLFCFFDIATGVFCLQQIMKTLYQSPPKQALSKAYLVTGLNNFLSGAFLCGPNTVFIESAFGMQLGGQKPLTLYVASILFIIFAFCFPLGQLIPQELFRGIFFFIGISLLSPIYQFKHQRMQENILSIGLVGIMMMSKSILNGLLLGIITQYLIDIYRKQSLEGIQHVLMTLATCTLLLRFI